MIGIIFNPTARGEKAQQFREHLDGLGKEVRVVPTRGPNDARALAAELVADRFETIVAAGGDGTVNEVLNGLCDAPDGLQQARLGVIPLGTVNVFAKEIGLPEEFAPAWRIIRAGHERRIDLPGAEFTNAEGKREKRAFILMAGAGLASRAVERVDWNLKKKYGPLAYIYAGKLAMRPPHPLVEVKLDDETFRVPMVELGNGRYFGGRFVLFGPAQVDDGQLHIIMVRQLSWFRLIRLLGYVLARRVHAAPDAAIRTTREALLQSEISMPLHLDGDVVGRLPARITIQPGALRVVVPHSGF